MVFRAKRAVKIVTTRLALISIGRIYGREIFKSSTSDITICQNSYFCKMYHIFDQDFDFVLISVFYLYRNIICGHLMPGLRPITTSKLINIFGTPCKLKCNQLGHGLNQADTVNIKLKIIKDKTA